MLRGSLFLLFFFYIFSEWGMRKEIALPWLGLWLLGYLAFGMLHVTGVIISSFFSTSSQNGAWEKRLHCLDWACDCWVTEGPNKDRFSSWRPISDACTCTNKSCRVAWWFNGRILTCHVGDPGPIPGQCKDSLLLSRMRACTISKNAQTSGAEAIFVWAQPWRDHSFCGVATFVQRLQQDSSESTNKQWKDMQLVIFCICSLCSPRVTPLYLFSHMDRQSFLAHDGIQTLDMLFRVWPKQRSLQLLKAYQRRVYLYQQKLQGIGGSMVEFSPATWEIRVQFPANARTASF